MRDACKTQGKIKSIKGKNDVLINGYGVNLRDLEERKLHGRHTCNADSASSTIRDIANLGGVAEIEGNTTQHISLPAV
jgi:hypothetical protein